MRTIWLSALSVLAVITVVSAASAQGTMLEASNWRQQANVHILGFSGHNNKNKTVAIDDLYIDMHLAVLKAAGKSDADMVRCLRKNNYWCLKNNSQWPGVIGTDQANHAVFDDPKFAAQAKVSVMRRYYSFCRLRSMAEIACSYAPPSDCNGSKFGVDEHGVCKTYNDCHGYANFVAGRMGLKPTDDLKLFDAEGQATQALAALMRATPPMELGPFTVKDELIQKGIAMERTNWRDLVRAQQTRVAVAACKGRELSVD